MAKIQSRITELDLKLKYLNPVTIHSIPLFNTSTNKHFTDSHREDGILDS